MSKALTTLGRWLGIIIGATTLAQGAESVATWIDQQAHLMWTSSDNGSGITGRQAVRYCRELRTGSFHDWELPSIEQLQTLVVSVANEAGYHIKGPIRLSGWQWSRTQGDAKGEQWALDFGDMGRASVLSGDSGPNRASCVRSISMTN